MRKLLLTLTMLLISTMVLSGCSGNSKEQKVPPQQAQEVPPQQGQKDENTVYLVQIPPATMLEQLKAKEIDGFIAWEPFNTVAVSAGDGKYLFKSPDIWQNHPCCVLAVSQNYTNAKVLEAYTWAHVKAIRFINDPQNKEKVIKYAAEFTGKSTEIAKTALTNITYVEYPDKNTFKEYYNSLENDQLLKKSVSDIGFADSEKFFDEFLQESVYQAVADKLAKDANWTPAVIPATEKVRVGFLNNDLHQLAIYVAEKEGYFQKVGLIPGKNYETKLFPNGVAVMGAFNAKDIDMAYLGGAPATLKRINDNISIDIVAGANNEGSGLVVRSDLAINSVSDLRGKTIAVPGVGTVQYTLLDKAVKDEGLKLVIK